MSFTYRIHEEAQKEYEKAIKWYLKRSLNAAEGFIRAVDFALKQACIHPTRWRNTYKHYYELGLKKIPLCSHFYYRGGLGGNRGLEILS